MSGLVSTLQSREVKYILFSVGRANTLAESAHRREEAPLQQGRRWAVTNAGGRTGDVRALGLAKTRPSRGGGLGCVGPQLGPAWTGYEVRIALGPAAISVLSTDVVRRLRNVYKHEVPTNSNTILTAKHSTFEESVSVSLHRTDTGTSINAITKQAKFDSNSSYTVSCDILQWINICH